MLQDDSSDGDSIDESSEDEEEDEDSSDEEEEDARRNRVLALLQLRRKRLNNIGMIVQMFGSYYIERFMDKGERRILKAKESGYEWVLRTLGHRTDCYKMFRMYPPVFHKLHNLLVDSYGLKSTKKMSSIEALAMFLWMVGDGQSIRQSENRFVRSMETVVRKFDTVLHCVVKLAADIIKPRDPEFRVVHERLRNAQWHPWFNDSIGAIDGTHVQVVVPPTKILQYLNRHGYCSQNVMAVCDFDMRFTFVLAGWPGSVHDMRPFKDALSRFSHKFPHPPPGKFYLVDSGYPNKANYLAPYRGQKYHFQEFQQGTMPRGKKEHFNYTHSRLRNVIERSFGVLKNKWRILFKIQSYPLHKQTKIIVACMALHNFIRESQLADKEFDRCDRDENYQPLLEETRRRRRNRTDLQMEQDSVDMNQLRDRIADGLFQGH
ncbi:hypothetical protein ACQJBY_037157 [Aegilops geniculata]